MATYTLITSSTLSVAANTVTFNNIPATYSDLLIKASARTTRTNIVVSSLDYTTNATGSVYSAAKIFSDATTPGADIYELNASGEAGYVSTNLATANTFGNGELYIPNYLDSQYKPYFNFSVAENNGTTAYMNLTAGLINSTTGLTSLVISGGAYNIVAGSTFYIYGVFNGPETLPSTPTIGTATAGIESASITFTPVSSAGVDTSYTALSTPGSFTATGVSSPITVTGLTAGTSYTFQVRANNSGGSSNYSSASNSITALSAGSYYSIASQTVSAVASVTFSSIPQTYKHLELRWYSLTTNAANGVISLRFNSISSANYESYYGYATGGSGTTSGRGSTGQTAINIMSDFSGTATSSTNSYSGIVNINDYTLASRTKSVIHVSGKVGADATNSEISWGGGTINPATSGALAAITQLVIVPLNASTMTGTFELYGIEG
jgi:hypothetical protein